MNQRLVYSFLPFLFYLSATAQINLVPNPSFEADTACPNNFSQLNFTGTWYQPTLGTSDYYNACDAGFMGVPVNWMGNQPAHHGQAYAGLIPYNPYNLYREYIETKLSSPLLAGQTYYLSMYVSLGDSSTFATDGMGAFLSPASMSNSMTMFNFNVTPQVSNPSQHLLSNTVNWMQISGSFTAVGGENYITIGNFKDDDSILKIRVKPPGLQGEQCYYFIDDVCLSQNPMGCVALDVGIKAYKSAFTDFYYNSQSGKIIFEDKTKNYLIKIIDVYGSPVKLIKLDHISEADVSDLKSGCYFVLVNDEKGEGVKKIIIN
jgi:OOP family OmpA-OmpF porin